jgi:hypothetical protein
MRDKALAVQLAAEAVATIERAGRAGSREGVMLRNTYATVLWSADHNEADRSAIRSVSRDALRLREPPESRRAPHRRSFSYAHSIR